MPATRKIRKAVIPAAGFGTRMLPATKAVPKEMLPVAGKPLIQYAVEEATASGIETVIIVVGEHKSVLQDYFGRNPELESFLERRHQAASAELLRRISALAEILYVEQREPLGLAHAISCAQQVVGDEAFVVLLPDVIMLSEIPVTHQLIAAHEQIGGSVIAIREVDRPDVERHGIVQADPSGTPTSAQSVRVRGLIEKPAADRAPSRLGVFGRYLLEPAIWDIADRLTPDLKGELQLTDALNLLCRQESVVGYFFEGQHFDAGDPLSYLKANLEIGFRDPRFREPLLRHLSKLHEQDDAMESVSALPKPILESF